MRLTFLMLLLVFYQGSLLTAKSAKTIEVTEGKDISIAFESTVREDRPFAILYNNVPIFRNGSRIEGALPPGQSPRLESSTTSKGLISLRLTITETDEENAGTYRLEGVSEQDDDIGEVFDLVVMSSSPANLWCTSLNDTTLSCRAVIGDAGQVISCTQGGQRLEPSSSTSGPVNATAQFIYNPSEAISCCTADSPVTVSPEDCSQFEAYPVTNQPDITTVFQNGTRETSDVSLTMAEKYFRATIGYVCFLLAVLVILYPFGMIYHFAVMMKSKKHESRSKGDFTQI